MNRITYKRPDGGECEGLLFEAAGRPRAPGLVVVQEWWGINEQIKGVAQQYADRGYRVLVPDLYRGKMSLDAKEAEHLMSGLDFADAAGQDIRGAVQYLKASAPKVGVTGYCMGGALTLLSACLVPELDAAVAWYGFPPLEYIDATKIKAPLMGHFAVRDAFFPIAQVDALEQKLKAAGVRCEFHRYEADHAFANETNVSQPIPIVYEPSAAQKAFDRTIGFVGRHLAA